ncbi:MAG: hypothetical protein J3Q66DRAFT_332341 [Benniella sp.]|nr:MAG: hypothetical protein J3Q66DRAFT_332341 [Benniella sp.]
MATLGNGEFETHNVWAEDDVASTRVTGTTTAASDPADLDMEEMSGIGDSSGSNISGSESLSASFTLVHKHEALEEESEKTPAVAAETTVAVEETKVVQSTISSSPSPSSSTPVSERSNKANRSNRFPSVGLYQGLGRLQAYSALAFGTFGIIHLVPPLLATVGGIELANKTLVWGRLYYQTYGVEQVFVYGSLGIHLGTSLCRVAVRMIWKAKAFIFGQNLSLPATTTTTTRTTVTTSSHADASLMSVTQSSTTTNNSTGGSASALGLLPYHRLAGWVLAPMVLSHMEQMRWAPVKVLGDSSMVDYSYITYLFRVGSRPEQYATLVGYATLAGLMLYHMFSGGPVAFNMILPRNSGRRIKAQELIRSKRVRLFAALSASVIVGVGVYRIGFARGAIPMARLYRSLSI